MNEDHDWEKFDLVHILLGEYLLFLCKICGTTTSVVHLVGIRNSNDSNYR